MLKSIELKVAVIKYSIKRLDINLSMAESLLLYHFLIFPSRKMHENPRKRQRLLYLKVNNSESEVI